jgi:ABC-type branched-subunit amino acid transport system substrate-binding protein
MLRNVAIKPIIAVCAIGLLFTGVGGTAFAASTTTTGNGTIKNEGPCDKSKSKVPVAALIVGATPTLDLQDQADALVASAKQFNKKYNGIGGHCFDLTVCDVKDDPNTAADCARQVAASDAVATLNDTTPFGAAQVVSILKAAGIPRVDVSPGTDELADPNSYAIGAGGAGTTFMMVPPLTRNGYKKIYMIGVDVPTIDALKQIMGTMAKAYGAEIIGLSKVPAGTTDFSQFVTAAEDAGADSVILPLGDNEAKQVLQAAQQLNSKLAFSVSQGTFGRADIKALGKFAKQMYFNAEIPPPTASTKTWPVLKNIKADIASGGQKENQPELLKSSPVRSWIALWHLKTIMENSGNVDNITKETVAAAMNSATDVDTFGLIPPWTPNKPSNILGGVFSRVSNPWYYYETWNGKDYVIAKNKLNVAEELNGNTKYDQPAAS